MLSRLPLRRLVIIPSASSGASVNVMVSMPPQTAQVPTLISINLNLAKRNEGPKKKAARNESSEEQIEQLTEAFKDGCFGYQLDWYRASNQRTRAILEARRSARLTT
jgi:hypothetical protein